MGCCCSCLTQGGSSNTETEMSAQQSAANTRQLSIARTMTQPTISIEPGGAKVSGLGDYHFSIEKTVNYGRSIKFHSIAFNGCS